MNAPQFWLGVYLGGTVAVSMMILATALDEGDEIGVFELLHAALWPVLLPWYLIDVARGWRP